MGVTGRKRMRFLCGEAPGATRGQQLLPPIPDFRLCQGFAEVGCCLAGVLAPGRRAGLWGAVGSTAGPLVLTGEPGRRSGTKTAVSLQPRQLLPG